MGEVGAMDGTATGSSGTDGGDFNMYDILWSYGAICYAWIPI